ncbi:MAG TPA: DUF1127 domain-containing protein [Mesorhizobium sp.]
MLMPEIKNIRWINQLRHVSFRPSRKRHEKKHQAAAFGGANGWSASMMGELVRSMKEMTMSTCELASETPRITTRPAVAARAVNTIAAFLRAWKNRRAFYRLGEMSNAELADIGLTRADLHVAIDIPFGSDPTTRLRALASDRAASAERMARMVG